MINLFKHKQNIEEDGIIFSFNGPMSHEIIVVLGETIRQKITEDIDGDKNVALKVFSVFVEQAENIMHYSVDKHSQESNLSFGIVAIGKKDGQFFISCGNKIPQQKEQQLQTSLTPIAAMDATELKQLYREKRRKKSQGDSKGAGIGFIEMARKSKFPIKFNFTAIDDEFSFFTIEITI